MTLSPLGRILAEDLERHRLPPDAARAMGERLREHFLRCYPCEKERKG